MPQSHKEKEETMDGYLSDSNRHIITWRTASASILECESESSIKQKGSYYKDVQASKRKTLDHETKRS